MRSLGMRQGSCRGEPVQLDIPLKVVKYAIDHNPSAARQTSKSYRQSEGWADMSERGIETTMDPASMTGGRPWASLRSWIPILRWNAMAWAALALVGWSAAGVAVVLVVREHQVTSQLVALAGFTPVTGPGIDIVLMDGTATDRSADNQNAMLVQSE